MALFERVHRLTLSTLFILYLNCIFSKVVRSDDFHQDTGNNEIEKRNGFPADKIANEGNDDNKKVVPAKKSGNFVLLAQHPSCKNDVMEICEEKIQNNNFAILDCLQDEDKVNQVSNECQHVVWNYKKNLTLDPRFAYAADQVCHSEVERFKCSSSIPGYVVSCLMDEKENMTDSKCKQYLTKMESIVFSDYQLIYKFTDHCEQDINNLTCGRITSEGVFHTQGSTIACLSAKAERLSKDCRTQILRIAELQSDDFHLDKALYYACRDDRERFCVNVQAGEGRVYRCLMKHKMDRLMSTQCREKLITRQKLINQDYKVSHTLAQACRDDIKTYKCRSHVPSNTREVKLSFILLCLEDAMHRGQPVSGECQAEMLEHRRSLMEDYRISPNIVLLCDREIHVLCNGLEKEDRTIHCLMKLAKDSWRNNQPRKIGDNCYRELQTLMKEVDLSSDVTVDSVLLIACKPVMETACHDVKTGDANVIPCLMDKLDSEIMNDECEESLLEIQYFISRDFRLDSRLYRLCHEDANKYCHAPADWIDSPNLPTTDLGPLVFPCLYKLAYHPEPNRKISPNCRDGVKRMMRQRAVSVDLMPEIEIPCLKNLAKFCSANVERGEEMDCLQKHFNELDERCNTAVRNFTEEEAEHIELNHILMKACRPIIQKVCEEFTDKEMDNGELMDCLIANKNTQKMNRKCAAGVEHFQLISLKDYRFNFKFKEACKGDVVKFCKNIKTKSDVIECLSSQVRDDTLKDNKHSISKDCRRQLKVELLQRNENIKLDETLYAECEKDVVKFCSDIVPGNAQILECLKSSRKNLSPKCHKTLFNREKEVMEDIGTDYTLHTICKKMIKNYCSDRDAKEVFKCLKENKMNLDESCKNVVLERQMEQSLDYRLNPKLAKACKRDIPKFCSSINTDSDVELEGKVISCLKEHFKLHKLSADCEVQIRVVMQEAALNFHLNPVLAQACEIEIKTLCSQEVSDDSDGYGKIEECLKTNLQSLKIQNQTCKQEVAKLVLEAKADIHVDPILFNACALDLKVHCGDITPGQGRQLSCLILTMEEKSTGISRDCRHILESRVAMFDFAAKIQPPETVRELMVQVVTSKSKNYFIIILCAGIGIFFITGLFCGRVTKRVHAELKNK